MIIKSYAKINLSLLVKTKLKNELHDIQSLYCQVNLKDTISIRKIKSKKDQIFIFGNYSKYVDNYENSISKVLDFLRNKNLISGNYLVKINKKIPVFSGLGGGTSNAASILNFFIKKKIKKEIYKQLSNHIGTDLKLFLFKQGFLKNLSTVTELKSKYKMYFLLIYPNIKCSTKDIYSKVKRYSRKKIQKPKVFKSREDFFSFLKNSNNDLQEIVERKYPLIKKLLHSIKNSTGCHISRMTGSGSCCYGLFHKKIQTKRALRLLKKIYPKMSFFLVESI